MSCTGAVASTADDAATTSSPRSPRREITERGETRADDRVTRGRDGGPQGCRATSNGNGNGHGRRPRSDLLRLATAGSVDDGKSTLIGRLLHDAKAILADQLDDLSTARDGDARPLALTDGLRAEREQGITIDVAYRYFATARRVVHPRRHARPRAVHAQHGHGRLDRRPRDRARRRAQRRGRADQAPRVHRVAARHPAPRRRGQQDGPRRLRRGSVFDAIVADFSDVRRAASTSRDIAFIPISRAARRQRRRPLRERWPGTRGRRCSSTSRPSRSPPTATSTTLRFPVQYVIRDHAHATTAATRGRSPAASCAPATRCSSCPAGSTTTVEAIDTLDGPLDEAFPPLSVTLRLADDLDISRGDLICGPARPAVARARARRRRLLDGRRAAAPARALPASSTPRTRSRRSSTSSSTASTSTRSTARAAPAELAPQRHRPRAAAHRAAGRVRPLRAQPRDGRLHPHRRGDERDRRRGNDRSGSRSGRSLNAISTAVPGRVVAAAHLEAVADPRHEREAEPVADPYGRRPRRRATGARRARRSRRRRARPGP